MEFQVVRANIVNIQADAIVCPSNTALKEGAGAARAIFEAAGRRRLTKACANVGRGFLATSVPTPAFDLNAKYILHAIVPKWIDGDHNEYGLLSATYLSSLKIADEMLECNSVAFPLLASGNNGYELELAFEIAEESIKSYEPVNLEKVTLVIYGERIKSIVDRHGYSVTEMPVVPGKLIQDVELLDEKKTFVGKMKKTLDSALQEDCNRALALFDDEEFRKKLLKKGLKIAETVLHIKMDNEDTIEAIAQLLVEKLADGAKEKQGEEA